MGRSVILPLMAAAALTGLRAAPVHAATQYDYFPSASIVDGRMLALTGSGLNTLAATQTQVRIVVPSSASTFDIGIFDGDTGNQWDTVDASDPTDQAIFSLYADPAGDGSGVVPANLVAQWTGNSPNPLTGPNWVASSATMPDNAWWDATVTPSGVAQSSGGAYVYTLVASLQDSSSATESCFKLRTTAIMGIAPVIWGFDVPLANLADFSVLYPDFATNDQVAFIKNLVANAYNFNDSTYDGTWTFYFNQSAPAPSLTLWGGDFDSGTTAHPHQPDPDTLAFGPDYIPPFAAGTGAIPAPTVPTVGSPQDVNAVSLKGRAPGVQYNLQDPLGNVYFNLSPSSSQFWEQFKITTDTAATRNDADYGPGFVSDAGGTVVLGNLPGGLLPAGVWTMNVSGLDITNTCFLFPPDYALAVGSDNKPAPVGCSTDSSQLWPPNHDLVNVANLPLSPGIDPSQVSVKVYSNEPDVPGRTGDDQFSPDATVTSTTNQVSVQLRSERLGTGAGRVYLVVATTLGPNGIPMLCTSTVTVPHDQSAKSLANIAAQAAAAEAFVGSNAGAIPPGYVQVGIGPVVGPKQ